MMKHNIPLELKYLIEQNIFKKYQFCEVKSQSKTCMDKAWIYLECFWIYSGRRESI